MLELVMAVCMIDAPARCKDVTLNFEGQNVTAQQCFAIGQIEMASWVADHPNWTIKKWRCDVAGQVAKI